MDMIAMNHHDSEGMTLNWFPPSTLDIFAEAALVSERYTRNIACTGPKWNGEKLSKEYSRSISPASV